MSLLLTLPVELSIRVLVHLPTDRRREAAFSPALLRGPALALCLLVSARAAGITKAGLMRTTSQPRKH